MFVLMVLYEACSPVPSSAAKTAVQLVFGRAHLVSKGSFGYHDSNFQSTVITTLLSNCCSMGTNENLR